MVSFNNDPLKQPLLDYGVFDGLNKISGFYCYEMYQASSDGEFK